MEFAPNAIQSQSASAIEEELNVIVEKLYNINLEIKKNEDQKSKFRSIFFDLASKYISITQTLSHEFVEGTFTNQSARVYVEKHKPEWRLVKVDNTGILIEEDPDKIKFVWTNDEGIQCSRNIAVIGAKFDIDAFVSAEPKLAKSVVSEKIVYEFDEEKAQFIIDENPELLPVFQDYALLGKIQTKLGSSKIIEKEEE